MMSFTKKMSLRGNRVGSSNRPCWFVKTSIAVAAGILSSQGLLADAKENLKFFENEVRPLLSEQCYSCHGEEKQKGGLRLDHISWIKKGGDSEVSALELMMEVVTREDEDFAMPPKADDALSDKQVAVFEKWIAMGAPWPEDAGAEVAAAVDEHGFTKEDYQWWAVQPVKDPSVPTVEVSDENWKKNPIDAFILRKLGESKLKPARQADKQELVRRAYFDLHGLPPTPEQIAAFVNDKSADAWPKLIDELLASPRYGERWASHWLDVVRYAESDGYRADDYRPGVWKYRDYVIHSLNEDKPYDQFVREQLAADEFAADDPDTLIATAFLRLGIYEWNQRNAKMQWDLIMTEMTNVTAEAFLGLGIGCAQCHDHKFDPILQKDHFALQAFLNTAWWPENAAMGTPAEKAEYAKQQAEWEAATADIRAELEAMTDPVYAGNAKGVAKQFPEDVQAIYNKPESERSAYEEQLAQLVQRQVDKRNRGENFEKKWAKDAEKLKKYKELKAKLAEFDNLKPAELPLGFITTDTGPEPATTFLKKRNGEEAVEPAFLTLLGQPAPEIEPTATTTGRRTALANWIADEKNPFSTRVIVNRLWQRHFGTGIVETPNDFGTLGEEPSHPELLDWLTSRFLDNGWKLKPLHRLIMTSAAYQQTARREPTTDEDLADPENKLLWRFPPKRLQAEQVRDAMLATSGEMKPREGGSSIDGNTPSRSVFMKKRRNSPDSFLGQFDTPQGFSSSPSRVPTTTPNQSLLLVNGEWATARSKAFARRILAGKSQADAEVVRLGFESAYGRSPSQAEIEAALAFIKSQSGVKLTEPSDAKAKYPGETGFRSIKEKFGFPNRADFGLGENSLWLQPDSKYARVDFSEIEFPDEEFTIEAVADIDSIHADSSVNTLLGRWNGSKDHAGWTFGVTSEKSGYQPRNFIMQLIGQDFQSNLIYEVVASDLRFPIQKPVYFAASVSANPSQDDQTKGQVTFYLKDLSDPKSPLQKAVVPTQIVGGLNAEKMQQIIGSRTGRGHTWDGQLARLLISEGALDESQLLVSGGGGGVEEGFRRVADFDFSDAKLAGKAKWIGPAEAPGAKAKSDSPMFLAVSDFCHALLTSNEFLYLH